MAFGLDMLKSHTRAFFAAASEHTAATREALDAATDKAAAVVAQACTEWTGRETSAQQVKRVALTTGVMALGLGAAVAVTRAATAPDAPAPGPDGEGVASSNEGSDDVVRDAGMLMAENGHSLNIQTVVVDMDGCEI
ncbi:MAG: hypothetical protein JKY37_18585 [Nannocystaceae bacterium]|nr:hypothetical protein [Nannocystaceae bacterium]